jgi:PKD repeat protein
MRSATGFRPHDDDESCVNSSLVAVTIPQTSCGCHQSRHCAGRRSITTTSLPSRRGNRQRSLWGIVFVWMLLASALAAANASSAQEDRPQVASGFSFSAAGDLGSTAATAASLERLAGAESGFFLALGDLSYEPPGTESSWCDLVKSKVGETYPFELLAGNHEDDGRVDGWIGNFVQCLPDRLGVTGVYGAEYYFDYPTGNPLARFILVSPGLTLFDVSYRYAEGDDHYLALASRIDEARSAGIPWVIVGMHKPCLSAGFATCEIGTDLLNLLVEKRVDLILQGHDHTYQRSKQLELSSECLQIVANDFDANCIADDGSDDRYAKARGPVVVINGAFGAGLSDINTGDTEARYFVELMGGNTPGNSFGFTSFTVTETGINVSTNFTDTFQDAFTIEAQPPAPPGPLQVAVTTAPTAGIAPLSVSFTSTVTGGLGPYRYAWTFGDQGTSTDPSPVHSYEASGEYQVNVVVTDSGDAQAFASAFVTVVAPIAADLSVNAASGTVPLSVSFSATASGGRPPYSFAWDFGDGGTSTTQNPSHTYQDPGTYVARVTVTDEQGQIVTKEVSLTASLPSTGPPGEREPSPGDPGVSSTRVVYLLIALLVGAVPFAAVSLMVWRLKRSRRPPPRGS